MSDDDQPVPVTIRPAMPVDPNKVTQAMDLPSRKPIGGTVLDQIRAVNTPNMPDPVKTERLAEDEIRRLNELREANIRKKQMGRPPGSKNKPRTDLPKVPPKCAPPKRDRHATGETTELLLFHDIMLILGSVPQEVRKRIIAALGQVEAIK